MAHCAWMGPNPSTRMLLRGKSCKWLHEWPPLAPGCARRFAREPHEARLRPFAWNPGRSVDSAPELSALRRTGVIVLALLGLGGLGSTAAGCAGWRGNTYFAHRSPPKLARKETTYRFGDPGPGWLPVRNLKDVQVAWVNRDIGGMINLHAQCDDQGDSSLEQYTDHMRIDWTAWKVESQEPARMLDRAALHTVVLAELDGVPRRNEFWVVKKNGCLFDLRYSAAPERFESGRAAFAAVVAGFRFPVRG